MRRRSTPRLGLPLLDTRLLDLGPQPLRSGPELFEPHPIARREQVPLPDGTISIRPVLPHDALPIGRLIRDLSLTSRYRRFHAPVSRLTAEQLGGIVDVDHHERETLVATVHGELVGLAQYVATAPTDVELALLVADRWQGRGIGAALAHRLVIAARHAGFVRASASVLRDNAPALALVRSLRATEQATEQVEGDTVEFVLHLDPAAAPTPPASVTADALAAG